MFRSVSKIGFIVLAILLFFGCKDRTPNYPITPNIEFLQFLQNGNGTATAKFAFKDGDQDIGNGNNDIHDIFLTLYQKNGNVWDSILTNGYSVPQMNKDGNRAYEGEIEVQLFEPYALPPATKYLVYLKDRAGHFSNKVWTNEIIP